MLRFDDEGARGIDRLYLTPDVVAQRERVLALLAPRPGERVLDVGSGPGLLLASIADAVGPEGAAHGLDPSAAMNALAADRTTDRAWAQVGPGEATALPVGAGAYDAAVCTQVYEYVPDVAAALRELRRVLRPGGRAVVLDTDWDSVVWHVTDRARQARVLDAWEEHLAHPRLPRVLAGLARDAGFDVAGQEVLALFNPADEPDTYSAHMRHVIAGFVTGRRGLTRADADAWLADLTAGGYFFSLNRYAFVLRAR